MGSYEMFLLWKLIFQKNNLIILILIGTLIIITLVLSNSVDSCSVERVLILNEFVDEEKYLEPEHCELLLERIYSFNDSCESEIEIIDCG